MAAYRQAIIEILEADQPMSGRHLFYRLCAEGVIEKDERRAKALSADLTAMRKDGTIPCEWIIDGTRGASKPLTFSNARERLKHAARTYRQDLWEKQPRYVEVWCEKDAIAGIIEDVTWEFDVYLLACRGDASVTALYDGAKRFEASGKTNVLLYLGDWDPSGTDMDRVIREELERWAPETIVHFERIGVLPDQIDAWDLPSRPTKHGNRNEGFEGDSVDLDAMTNAQLQAITRDAIEALIDPEILDKAKRKQKRERRKLQKAAD